MPHLQQSHSQGDNFSMSAQSVDAPSRHKTRASSATQSTRQDLPSFEISNGCSKLSPMAQEVNDLHSPVACGKSHVQHELVEKFSLKEQKPDKPDCDGASVGVSSNSGGGGGAGQSSAKTAGPRKCLRALFHTENAYEDDKSKSPTREFRHQTHCQNEFNSTMPKRDCSRTADRMSTSSTDKKRQSPHEILQDNSENTNLNGTSNAEETLVIRKRWKRALNKSDMICHSGSKSRADRLCLSRSTSTPTISSAQCYLDLPYVPILPTIPSRSHPDLNVISPQTVASVLNGDFDGLLASYTFIDCRFDYEHEGGTIHNSVLLTHPEEVERTFLHHPPQSSKKCALIFFCEYSSKRAPNMIRHFRNLDRRLHETCYPDLFYPELYLIDGGYKNCFESLKEVCAPQQYTSMNDKQYLNELKSSYSLLHAQWKSHKGCACMARFPNSSTGSTQQQIVASDGPMKSVPLLTLGRWSRSEQL